MEEPQNPYAEIQEPKNKPSSDANETRKEGVGSQCCAQVLILFFNGLLILFVFALMAQNDLQSRGRRFDQPVKELLASGANINSIEGILHNAVEKGNIESVKKLLAPGADIDPTACMTLESPLHRGVTRENIAIIKLLINSGTDLNMGRKNDGRTPLDMAQSRELVETEQLLRAAGASISQ